jgi:hypothetical protein
MFSHAYCLSREAQFSWFWHPTNRRTRYVIPINSLFTTQFIHPLFSALKFGQNSRSLAVCSQTLLRDKYHTSVLTNKMTPELEDWIPLIIKTRSWARNTHRPSSQTIKDPSHFLPNFPCGYFCTRFFTRFRMHALSPQPSARSFH